MQKIMFNDKYNLTWSVLNNFKTQTRRTVKFPKVSWADKCTILVNDEERKKRFNVGKDDFLFVEPKEFDPIGLKVSPKYKVGEVVAIAQRYNDIANWRGLIPADEFNGAGCYNKMFVKADYMPHHIRITDIRIERLNDISDDDIMKEGLSCTSTKEEFAALIDRIGKRGDWKSNPYVFVYGFKLVD